MATDKNLIEDAAAQQREQLRRLLLDKVQQPEKISASCAQRRLWVVDRLEKPNASYNNPCHITIRGSLDIPLLEKSINLLIARHSVLRTTFIDEAGQPFQSISDELVVTLPCVSLVSTDSSDRKQRIADIVAEESSFIFDLSSEPLFRVRLLHSFQASESSSGEEEHVLIIVLHHIISDGWSIGVVVRDLFTLYDELKNNSNVLKPLSLQYSDFSQRQSRWLKSDDYRRQLSYWKEHLRDLSALELVTDFTRPPVKNFNGANFFSGVEAPLVKRLRKLCDQQSVTMSMLLTTMFSLLLHRYTGQTDIVFGSPIANRNQAEIENLIGFFANMQVIRNQVEPTDSFFQLLDKTRTNLIEAYSNQDVPFENLVDVLQPVRDRSRNPLFQVLFAMQNEVMPSIELEGLLIGKPVVPGYDVSEYAVTTKVTRFDFELHCWEDEDNIRCSWVYDTDLFDAATVQRISDHFEQLLLQVVAHPARPVGELNLLTEPELQQLAEWNQTEQHYEGESLVQLFEAQVDKTPDATAVVFENTTLSYQQFEQRANQLAHYLQSQGIGPGDLVGVCMLRSIEMVVALYGILKAGGAYVPLDPEYPAARLGFMLEDTQVKLILGQSQLEDILADTQVPMLLLDSSNDLDKQPASRLEHRVHSDDAAYVIYTSGSTGQPKGVINNHRGIVNRLCWMQQQFGLDADDHVLQKTPYSFDVSVWEFFWPLICGAQLVIARADGHRDPAYLAQIMQQAGITTLHFVPSMLNAWLDYQQTLAQPVPTNLKRVMCSGEALGYQLQQRFFEQIPAPIELHNLYGPTEAAVDVTYWHCQRNDSRHIVPIGHAIANTSIHVLDKQMQPVPVGVNGELHIGGVQVARGYLNRLELTNEKFIDDPFSEQPGARIYKTGDLARYLPDGCVEYIGRMDNQVKLRGLRIEPGEIEAQLCSFDAVNDAVVVVHEEKPGEQLLVAYIVAASVWLEGQLASDGDEDRMDLIKTELTAELIAQLKSDLKINLPEYMVPSLFVLLDALPLSANGKVDRRSLPIPGEVAQSLRAEYTAPRNEIEEQLVQIWTEVLKLERVGVQDNFFDLGGHSLLATQVTSRISGRLKVDISLSEMFNSPTVAELAPVIGSLQDEGDGKESSAIVVVDRRRDLPLSFAQERLWFLDQLEPGNAFYNMPLVIGLQGELDSKSLQDSLNLIVSRHESLRTHFTMRSGQPVQVIGKGSSFELLQEDLGGMQDESREAQLKLRIREEALQPFDLETDSLVRVRLIRLAAGEHILLFTMHHIVSDGWSLGVLCNELTTCYAAFCRGQQPELKPLPLQYVDFAAWQREWLSGELLASQMAYWEQKLENLPMLVLPTDRPRPPVQTFNGAMIQHRLPEGLSSQLSGFSQQEGVSLFMTLMAVFAELLHRYTGQDDIVIGSPIANRNRSDLEDLIGFFVNSLVMRTDVSGNPSFSELVQRVNSTALGAFDHQDLPFEKLVDEIQPERNLSQNPLFQVIFALQNAPMDPLTLEGLRLQMIPPAVHSTRFDLEVHAWEEDESLNLRFIYNTDLFDEATIERMSAHYQTLLQEMMKAPDLSIGEFPMLSAQEHQQILYDWNNTTTDYPRDKVVQTLFEEQVIRKPDAVAVEFGTEQLSYRALNERANQLAHYLRQRGVGPEVGVGVYLERSLEMIVALLGIVKAGGAYVPLDLEYPSARIAFMLEDAQVPVLLSMSNLSERLPEFSGKAIWLDTDWVKIGQEGVHNPEVTNSADDLAYVIYTSGSTGTPKGVEIGHRAINRLVRNTDYYQVGPGDRVAQASNSSFDAATFEIWGALLNGAQLVGINKDTFLNPRSLAVFLHAKSITAMFITTAVFNQIAREAPDAFSGLRGLMFGGEAVDCNAVRQVLASDPPERLLHVYGPTESTTFASWYLIEAVAADATTVPIGRPLANTILYVLDHEMRPVPVGVSGQLYIGGDGLARGYLDRPELTAEKFVPNPYSDDPQARLYATGDKVRYRQDGAIEFMGRFDDQIKLRGFRIELGEIETALINHETLRDAVAVVREDEPGNKRIAAYVVPTAASVEQISSSQSGDHVDEWQALYEETYDNVDASLDLTENFTGWNSSYTGEPIPLAEMTEWQDSTVARIAALEPRQVLEIGCGTGLLLYRLAPGCERYVGTDFSAIAQQQVRGVVTTREELQHVELWQRMADDFSEVEAGDFDTVIINSVTQYLPSMDYLASVVEGAVATVVSGGRIMLGDIRSLPLLKAYHTSVQLYLSPDEANGAELLRNIQQHVEEENELVIEPAFFHALKQRIPRLSHVEILLKRGQYHNELTGYRYDVVLHVEAQAEALPTFGQWLDWGASGLDQSRLQECLAQSDQAWLGINAIPNARIADDVAVLEQLQEEGSALSVGELKQGVESAPQTPVEPDALWRLAEEMGYQLELSYSGAGTDGRMDALFRRSPREDCAGHVFWPQQQAAPERPWSAYGTNPLKGRLGNELIPRLRQDLQQDLPEYMLPSVYVVLDALPLNPNGKVDRKALPVPGDVRASLGAEYTAARTELEQQLAEIWAEVLKLERVGIHDNFFDLGGHSLMATQVVSRIRAQLNVELPLSEMFGYPTVAELAPVVESLLAKDNGDGAEDILVADRRVNLPLSFAQQRLWFLDQLEPESPAYNVPAAIKLKGSLEITALRNSLQEIVNRHEVLRTTFAIHEGQPVQKITKELEFELLVDDLSAIPEPERSGKLERILGEDALRPFNLETGPMMRGRLLRLGDNEHILMFAMHHIVSDGWSLGVFFRELGALYEVFSHGLSSPLPALPVQYADFALWQRQWLSGNTLQTQLDYWKNQLDGVSNMQLPNDRARPAAQTFSGAQASLVLDSELTEQLEKINKQQGTTLFMTLLAAFSILLKRYCGQDEIVVGTPIANRNHRDIEDLIGFFVNTLVFRTDLSGDPTYAELLDRVKHISIDAYEHQDLPFETVVDELQLERDRSRNPLFQVLFAVQNAPSQTLSLEGLTLEIMPSQVKTTRFDLETHICQGSQGLSIDINYNTDLFNADTVERMLAHYRTLIEQITANTACRIGDLELLTEAENQQVVVEWNQTHLVFPGKLKTVQELFEAQVERTPEDVALEFAGSRLTYRELNVRANQLAHYLRGYGVGPDKLVGICLQRGLEAAVAVLAVLKAGGGYTPLDPAYPEERLGFMLQDSQCVVLVTQTDLAQRLPTGETPVLCLDAEALSTGYPQQNPDHQTQADNTAYVIFTSGSTGRPKGIVMPHSVLCNLIQWQLLRSGDLGSGRTLQFSAFSFDVAFQEMFATLCAGGTLVLVGEELRRDPVELLDYLDKAGINRLFMPFAGLNQLSEAAQSTGRVPGSLREIITAGEALQVTPALEYLFDRLGDCTLDNQYGPSETHVVTANRLKGSASDWPRLPAIGRPIANARIFLLDEQLRPVPVGVPGEMYIGGDCLARGYLGREDLTDEKFIADPFSDEDGARLYRTGDLARYGADGSIEFMGRADSQVKLRGYRIEPGEIEAVLMEQAEVQACVAMVREDQPGDRRLVAYYVGPGLAQKELRAGMKKKLPEFMLPSRFIELEDLPLTPSGKLDRRALPAPDDERQTAEEYVEPRTELERQLVNIWQEVLSVDRIGMHDDFFELGGHSLMATQVVRRIRERLEVELPLSDMFGYPTVAELGQRLEMINWTNQARYEENLAVREVFKI